LLFRPAFGLRDELSVLEQAQVFGRCLGNAGFDVDSLLDHVGLREWATEKVMSLSSGQRARLGMSSLIVSRANIWLLDEPLNALDYDSLQLLARLMTEHLKQGGFILLVSHLGRNVLAQELKGIGFEEYVLSNGRVQRVSESEQGLAVENREGAQSFTPKAKASGQWFREFSLLLASTGSLLWSGLFLLMVLSFFGLVIRKPDPQVVLAVTWMAVILCSILSAKDWFLDDLKSGWLRLNMTLHPTASSQYWLAKVGVTIASLWLVVLPVCTLGALLVGAPVQLLPGLILALLVGVFATVPLLALVSLMVLMTRGGAVLVYILALPLLVPVMIFGLEASQAEFFGRSAWPALGVLFSAALMGLLLGPVVAKKLISLILE
jgi:heme exporter protein CcmB